MLDEGKMEANCVMWIVFNAFYRSTASSFKKVGEGGETDKMESAIASSATLDSRINIRVAPYIYILFQHDILTFIARQKEVKAKERENGIIIN